MPLPIGRLIPFDHGDHRSDFAASQSLFLLCQPAFVFRTGHRAAVREFARAFHSVPEIDQLLNLFWFLPRLVNQWRNSSSDPCGSVRHEQDATCVCDHQADPIDL